MFRKLIFTICFIGGYFSIVQSQTRQIFFQNLYWTRYYNQLAFNSKWSWHNELDNRRFFEHNIQHHFISHSHLHYLILPNLDLSLGVTYSRQSPQFTNLPNRLVVPEIRPFQEITLTTPFSKRLTFSQRLRIDERFIHSNNGIELLNGYEFNWRFRYRMQATVLISKIGVKYPTHLKLANELMINAGKNIVFNYFDQNRFYVGIEHAFSKKIAIEAGYLHWFQQRNTGNQFFNRDIFRLTLYHRIKL